MSKEIQKELKSITSYLTKQEKDKVIDALRLSQEAHSNQLRKSGDPFITHPLEVAKILTSIKLDADSIVAGLLHDTLEDTNLDINEINKNFGTQIVELVDGLTKINKYSLKVKNQKYGENYKKLILADHKVSIMSLNNGYFRKEYVRTNKGGYFDYLFKENTKYLIESVVIIEGSNKKKDNYAKWHSLWTSYTLKTTNND